jgi:Domain of unknown function (DUF5671)
MESADRMKSSEALYKFLDTARGQGATDETLVGLLRGRGWPEEDVYRALADHYEARGGVAVPAYKRSGSAKDAFLYLLSFSTLATWTIGLGSVMFTLIERWIRDPLTTSYYYSNSYYQMAGSLACIIVAFPVYLFVMRYIVREVDTHPEKLESAVRKWLTYLALLIAAGVDHVSYLLSEGRADHAVHRQSCRGVGACWWHLLVLHGLAAKAESL